MGSLPLFFTVFGVIFLAELPDKTALATMALATRLNARAVFLGACLALTVQSAIAVVFGSLLATLPPRMVHIGAGILFIGCGVILFLKRPESAEANDKAGPEKTGFLRALWSTFALVFIAELGDLTQLGTAGFQAKYHAWLPIFTGSTLALWSVAAIAVFVGSRAQRLLDPRITQRVAALVFTAVGALLVAGVL